MSLAEPAAVEVAGVTQRYGKTTALSGVTLSFPSGSATALVGPDGVGKSTLLGLIAGVRRLQSGTIRTLGGDIDARSHRGHIMARIAYMPQGLGRNLYPSLSVVREHRLLRPLVRPIGAERRSAKSSVCCDATGLHPFRRPARRQAVGRHEAEARPVLRADP